MMKWSRKQLFIVLLPSASKRRDMARLGIGEPDGGLHFEPLDMPMTTVIRSASSEPLFKTPTQDE
jgi:hypothetical protein